MSRNNYIKAVTGIKRFFILILLSVSFFIAFSTDLPPSYAAKITIVNLDKPNEGFNDKTAWTPSGGNPATTLGQARLNAFQFAANIWGSFLVSNVEIFVDANFDSMLPCDASSAVLGHAGPNYVLRDFSGAPVANTWYVQALANSLYGSDLLPAYNDINATFNSNVDNSSCLGGTDWYYGYDGNPGGDIDFVSVALHELAHGLGFLSLVDLGTGAKSNGYDDAYMRHLEHHGATPPDYPSMTDAQRVAASVSIDDLHWIGPNVIAASGILTSGKTGDHVWMYAPNPSEPGSSVSHWDITLFPNQLMEPYYTGVLHDPGLELELFMDIGWNIYPTLAGIAKFTATSLLNNVIVEWETNSETGTIGFYLYRLDEVTGEYLKVNNGLIPGLLHEPQGGVYRCIDKIAMPGETYTYKLIEVEKGGRKRTHGPYTIKAGMEGTGSYPQADMVFSGSGYNRKARGMTSAKKARIAARKSAGKDVIKSSNMSDTAKVAVSERGLYYIDASEIADAIGKTTGTVTRWIRQRELIITSQGQEVAWLASSGNAGIYFYGEAIDSIYTDKNIYWVGKGKRGEGLEMVMVNGEGPDPVVGYAFQEIVHAEEDHYALTALFDDPQADYWMWDYIIADSPYSSKTFSVSAHGIAEADTAILTVYLQGVSDTESPLDNHVEVNLNESRIGEGYWSGASAHTLVLEFDHALLNEGENTIEVTGLLDTGAAYSIFYVDSFDLAYQRRYQAVDNRLFVRGDENEVVTVEGFTNENIIVFDLRDPKQPKIVSAASVDNSASGYQVSFRPAAPDELYLVMAAGGSQKPLSITGDRPSDLKQETNRFDYLIITSPEMKEAARTLANYRESQGLDSMVVDVEDIMDEFNHGLFNPEAIRDFLSFAYNKWEKPPRYIVLAGEGTYDYKDNQGYGDNLVPAMMAVTPDGLFASDNRYADVDGNDGVPDMAIGRLPVMIPVELDTVIYKIIAYESAGGAWARKILMVADNPDDGGNFPADSDFVADMLSSEYMAEKIYLSEYSVSEAQALVLHGINEGALLLNYIGHAGMDRLAHEGILLASDVGYLENGDKLPVVTAMTCLAGRFAIPGFDSLGELLVLHDNGGSVAAWAPTGLSLNGLALTLDEGFFYAAFIENRKILGDVVLKALKDYASSSGPAYMLDIYNLLGDPALRMR